MRRSHLFAIAVLFGLLFATQSTSAQGLRVIEPAAGAEVGEAFDLKVGGEPGEFVRITLANEEIARLKLGRDGRAQARVQAPESSPFTLVVEQLEGEEVVSMTSIRLTRTTTPTPSANAADVPPPPGGPDAEVDATADELPPPPPPPDMADEPATDTFEKEDPVVETPPPIDESQPATEADDGLPTTTIARPPPKPRGSTRLVRILISGTVGLFAVPTGWFVGVLGLGILTNFDDGIDNNTFGWVFLTSGTLAAAGSTWITGELLKGNGSFLATLAGAVLVSGFSLLAFETDDGGTQNEEFFVAAMLGSFGSIGGAIIGYEVTSDTDADFSAKTGIHDAMISASPNLDGDGFSVGLSGRF